VSTAATRCAMAAASVLRSGSRWARVEASSPGFMRARYPAVGVATLAGSCFGASDHGPVSFRRVGQSVDLPVKARRWGHDLRGSRQSGWLKSWSRPPQPRCVLTSCTVCLPLGRERAAGGAERGGDMSAGASGRPLPPGGAKRRRVLDEVEKPVTRSPKCIA